MINEDTIYLLRECNAGTQMAVYSIGEILENVKDQKLREILISSKNHHEQLGNELHILLQKYGDTTKDPGVIAKGMSWIKTNAKLAIDDSDRVCADLITDGCHMGTKTMQRHINQYLAADREARGKAEELIRMEELLAMMGDGTQKAQLKILLKGDVQGSVEAIKKAIMDIQSDKVECVFLNASAGPISESDVLLASSSDAVILGFNVKVEANAVKLLKREGVQVKLYSIVYELIDQVRDAMLGLLEPETRETIIGHAKVLQVFKLNKGRAAGCMVEDGKILRSCEARVIRDKTPVFDGKMSTLRRFQDEVEEVKAGLECGIRLGDFNEYEAGDIIECYTLEKIQQTL